MAEWGRPQCRTAGYLVSRGQLTVPVLLVIITIITLKTSMNINTD